MSLHLRRGSSPAGSPTRHGDAECAIREHRLPPALTVPSLRYTAKPRGRPSSRPSRVRSSASLGDTQVPPAGTPRAPGRRARSACPDGALSRSGVIAPSLVMAAKPFSALPSLVLAAKRTRVFTLRKWTRCLAVWVFLPVLHPLTVVRLSTGVKLFFPFRGDFWKAHK